MWRIQSSVCLIDLLNDFFIVRFKAKEDYDTALLDGPWLIADHYLHVQRWKPNFIAETTEITHLHVWICSPMLPVEYYTSHRLQRAGNQIGKTLKVVYTTLLASRGRFASISLRLTYANHFGLRIT